MKNPEKNREYQRAWRKANREKHNADNRKAYANNPQRKQAVNRAWKDSHPERYAAIIAAWQKAHPERGTEKTARWQMPYRDAATPGWANREEITRVYAGARKWGWCVDHIVPLRNALVCGLHVTANLQAMDRRANSSKANRIWPDMPWG